jgi:hypothetical protein
VQVKPQLIVASLQYSIIQGGKSVKNVLNGNLKIWHLMVFGIMVMLFTGGTIALADTDTVKGFLPPGEIRLANAYANTTVNISGTDTPPVIVLSTTINVPDGKKADLQTTFTADLHHNSGTYSYCFGSFALDNTFPDTKFRPNDLADSSGYQLLGGDTAHQPSAVTVTMTGFRKNVGAGTHTVNVYINSAYAGCTLFARNLNVIANIR